MKKLMTALVTGATALGTAVLLTPVANADTVCGYNPKVVAVGPTSCPFALNVANTMMSGASSPFRVSSPTTGESYLMTCRIEAHGSTTCRGGDDAVVVIY
jgi:hypothetical protein